MICFKTELINTEDTLKQMTHKIKVISFIIETNTKTEKATVNKTSVLVSYYKLVFYSKLLKMYKSRSAV